MFGISDPMERYLKTKQTNKQPPAVKKTPLSKCKYGDGKVLNQANLILILGSSICFVNLKIAYFLWNSNFSFKMENTISNLRVVLEIRRKL